MKKTILLLIHLFIFSFILQAQTDRILLENPSFEDVPRMSTPPSGWSDCGMTGESPPDVQPGGFNVTMEAYDGETYLGIVARDNETWEGVGQRLSSPLEAGNCYQFRIFLSSSDEYFSVSRTTLRNVPYTKSIVFRIWGGHEHCGKEEILSETQVINHSDWKEYPFVLQPKANYDYIVLEAFYKTPSLFPYNGNILVDNASDIILKETCDDKIDPTIWDGKKIIAAKKPTKKKNPTNKPKKKTTSEPKEKTGVQETKLLSKEPKIMTEFSNLEKMEVGQLIRIKQLNFGVNDHKITSGMHAVLDEIFEFLEGNSDVRIEIGGHTNTLPTSIQFANRLSTSRALAVTNYLIKKGIKRERLSFKGYGKSRPIDNTNTAAGHQKNQRVEIKIINL